MKKVTSLILLFIALLWAGYSWGVTVQIGSGTTTITTVPISSCYGYTYSQEIYLGSEIQFGGGGIGPITKVRFFYNTGGTTYSTWSNWTIYIGTTAKTAFASTTDWEPLANLTQVFSGTIPTPVAGTWLELTLSTPFNYTGGNLIVAVDENSASYSCSAAWRSFTPGGNRGMYYRNDVTNPDPASPPAGVTVTAIAQIQFEMAAYVPTTPPNCATIVSPANAGVDIAIGTTLNWASGGGAPTGYKLFFGTDNPPTNIVSGTDLGNVTTYTPVAPLSYSTTYYWKVVAYNTNGDATGCSQWSFTTMADPTITSLPYYQGFEGTTFAPVGWTNVKTVGTGTPGIWDRQTSGTNPTCAPHGGTAMARYNCYSLSSGTKAILVTPPINIGSDDFELTFWMYRDNGYPTTADLVNIYSNASNNLTGATLLGTINRAIGLAPIVAANGWYEYKMMVPNPTKGILYVIFEAVSIFGNNIFIDDIKLDFPPPCVPPSGLAADNFTTTSADLSWVENGTATQWNIEYGAFGFTQGTGTVVAANSNPFPINGLSPATKYSFYVQADCGSGMTSTWAGPSSFVTECDPSILPFAEGFESAEFPPVCWENTGWVSSLYGSANSGTKWAYSNLAGSQLVSPEIVIPAAGGYQLSFWYRAEGATNPQDFDVLISTDGTNFTQVMSFVDVSNITYSEAVFKLLDYNGQNIWVRFDGLTGTGGFAYGVCIDDVTVDLIPPPGFISGIVTDEATGLPIEGAFVTTTPGGFAAISMANGNYAMQVDKGTYSVTCQKDDYYYSKTVSGVVVQSSLTTTVNLPLTPIPAPYCANLVGPADNATDVLPSTSLSWAPGTGSPPALGYKLQLYNVTTGVWILGDELGGADLGNVTTYTPAEPFDWATDYVWLITPYNNAGSPEGCFPWLFSTASGGSMQGIVKDQTTGLPIHGAKVFIEQTYPPSAVGTTFTLYSAADGTWNFDWVSGVYKITYSKFTYVSKTVTNIAIYPNQTTNQSVFLTPETPYQIPFVERWNAPTTFNTQKWTVVPTAANWSVYATSGNPAPSARFYYEPRIYNYERTLQSFYINGVGKPKIYAQFDLFLQNFSKTTLETMTFMVYDGYQWNNVAVFDNQQGISGSIPWTTFTFDISSWAAGKQFLIGFKAAGQDSYNVDWWFVDNINITTNLMDVAPASITDAIDKTQTSVHNITITNPGISPLYWNATFNVPSPWATLTAMSGVVSAGTSATVPLTFSGNAVPPGVYDAIITFSAAGGVVQKTVAVHLDIYELQIDPTVIFDELNTTETSVWNITLTNPGTLPYVWNATFDAEPWFGLSETNGVLQGGGQKVLSLTFYGDAVDPGSYEGEIDFTAAGGLIQKTVDLGLNVYDMTLYPESVYDALMVGGSVTHQIEIHNPYTGNLAWTATVPVLPWLSMTPIAGNIPAGGTILVDITFDATGVPAGEYSSQITFDGAGGNVVKDLSVGLNVYNTPFQKVMIPEAQSWGYISSYINLDSKMTLEEAMEDILDEMIIMVGNAGVFWPSQNINTIGNWNPLTGYKIKMGEEGLLVYVGDEVTTKTINYNTAGVYIIPVLSDVPVSREDLFDGKPIEFAFGLDGSIYWPAGNIFTLNTLYPGFGYLVKFTAATTLNFNVKGVSKPNTPDVYVNKTSWNDVFRTGDVHIVGVSPEACSDLLPGDVIGVFNAEGLCTAMAGYSADKKSFAFTVFADDQTTMEIDGMTESQQMLFKVYRDNVEMDLIPVFNTKMPNNNGLFTINGLSQISSFKVGSIGIGENELSTISVYPNPTSGIFNITLKGIDAQLRVVIVNSQGQEIYSSSLNNSSQIDLTSQPRGVYFVKIIGNDVLKTEKLIVK